MLTELRQSQIMNYIQKNEFVKVEELMELTNASVSTIRRDLQHLEKSGKVSRIHGGAKIVPGLQVEADVTSKSKKNLQAKQMIAKFAAQIIKPNEVVYIDSGTSTSEMMKYLANIPGILVVTNGIAIALLASKFNIACYMLGGQLKATTQSVVGIETVTRINNFQFDRSFIGINGIHESRGLTTPDIQEAEVKQAIFNHSSNRYIVADHSKFDQMSFVKVGDLDSAVIISDGFPKWILNNKKVKILEANFR